MRRRVARRASRRHDECGRGRHAGDRLPPERRRQAVLDSQRPLRFAASRLDHCVDVVQVQGGHRLGVCNAPVVLQCLGDLVADGFVLRAHVCRVSAPERRRRLLSVDGHGEHVRGHLGEVGGTAAFKSAKCRDCLGPHRIKIRDPPHPKTGLVQRAAVGPPFHSD